IRPMVPLDGGRYAASDLNDLYRRVINRNNRLKKLLELNAPQIIIRNEKRMLQEAVDALIDNGRRGKPVTGGSSNRPLKSLSEVLRGKQGRFRQNLLGKRVDYSGRSVIVVGPELKIYQCGLPKEMALELFKPFVMKRLVETNKATNIKDAKKKVEKVDASVWDALEAVISGHPVLLNRAPTLHRLSIQAFEPILVEGRAIKLHPLVCTAFNADFDGDQMPIHVPLSSEAQAEARFLMLSANNLLKPSDGHAVAVPSQDMVLGSYYLTIERDEEVGHNSVYRSFDEAMMAYQNGCLGLHTTIYVRVTKEIDGVVKSQRIKTTLGRMIFNREIPQDLGFVDRSKPENQFVLEINETCGKSQLKNIVDRTIKKHGTAVAAEVLDRIKAMGYKYSTRAAISISVADVVIPEKKPEIIKQAEAKVEIISTFYQNGELTEDERYKRVLAVWEEATNDIVKCFQTAFGKFNPIKMMADSGARGNITQMRQLAGMRGLMSAANGRTMEIPIKANFREGLNILEYFVAARGARKSLSDTALRTADSGYLTRRLVDVSQEVIIKEDDCGATEGIWVSDIVEKTGTGDIRVIENLKSRLWGRYTIGDITDSEGKVIVANDTLIDDDIADSIVNAGIKKVHLRTILQCRCKHGVCAHCYGADMSNGKKVSVGEAVGIIAAQSIGEPGTQLTMRTFHTGGVAGSDITQGLPRVEEVFEARRPKKTAEIARLAGTIKIGMENEKHQTPITITDSDGNSVVALIPYNLHPIVKDNDYVELGDPLTDGYIAPQDLSNVCGLDAAYDYIIKEVQKVYRLQSVTINDKHIEVIARQMTRKVKIEDQGSTNLLSGSVVDRSEFISENLRIKKLISEGGEDLKLATMSPVLLGITKAALATDSFLSAASFQETTKVLTEAAIKGKVDNLIGLKENVIIGKLIPAGTGIQRYRDISIKNTKEELVKNDFSDSLSQSFPVRDQDDDEDEFDETLSEEEILDGIEDEIESEDAELIEDSAFDEN
ncbi:MAG: DNA-directed RNA polymerase subunit beta', partial [Ruminococcaceae bacterium]|nr:DNA-directed RNA polymerase subunit beta' [Oscillospiraceae bacterium]